MGSTHILNVLRQLDVKLNWTPYNKKVRQYARLGIVYHIFDKYESYCPFCWINNKKFLLKTNCCYPHAKKCNYCREFRNMLDSFNDQILTMFAEFCSRKDTYISTICSKELNQIIQFTNPFYQCIKRSKLIEKIHQIFELIRQDMKNNFPDEFCSILIDGSKRNDKTFYAVIIHSKSCLFYLTIKQFDHQTSEELSSFVIEILNWIISEINVEIISACTDHAKNLIKILKIKLKKCKL